MRRGARAISRSIVSGLSPAENPSNLQLCSVLLVASVAKTLSQSGTRNLDPNSIRISEPLVLQILRRNSLEPSRRLDFFRWCFSLGPNYKHSAAAYAHIFRTVCRAGLLVEVRGLLDLMKEDGVLLDQGTLKILLDSLVRAGKFNSALEILQYIEESGAKLNHNLTDSVLIALVRKNQVALALSMFFKLLETFDNHCDDTHGGGVVVSSLPRSIAVNELLVGLRKADMKLEFRNVFEKVREVKGFKFDTWGYNICIHAFGCWGDLDAALSLFREMKEQSSAPESSVAPDLCTYNSLLHVLCLLGKLKNAMTVWNELKVSGHEPDAFTYRIMIQGCCKSYRMDDAMEIFSEMQYNGFTPDTIVYNSLLDGMLKARKTTEACQLFEKMVHEGVRASCWTYNILIDGLMRNGRAEAGYTLFCDLKKKGQFVDAITYSIIALRLCKEGQLDKAMKLVEEMEARGFSVDLVTISSLLIECYRQGQWDWTERLVKHVRETNLVPGVLRWKAEMEASLKTPQSREKDYTPMFPSNGDFTGILNMMGSKAPSDAGNEEELSSHVEEDPLSSFPYMDQLARQSKSQPRSLFGLARGQRIQEKGMETFDIDMMNTFLSIYLSKGDLSLACKLFEIFNELSMMNPTSYTYNSIMSSFVKRGYFKTAHGVLELMSEKVCPADIATYNIIIQGLGKMGRADLATTVLERLTKQGGYLDIVMYNTLIHALGRDGRVDEAHRLFEQMKNNGINPDVVSYNTMIELNCRDGRLKDAYRFLKMMLDAGCSPNHVTDTILDYLGKEMEKCRYTKASFVRTDKDDHHSL